MDARRQRMATIGALVGWVVVALAGLGSVLVGDDTVTRYIGAFMVLGGTFLVAAFAIRLSRL